MRPIREIALDIHATAWGQLQGRKGFPNWWHWSQPYLGACLTLDSVQDDYGADTGRSCVLYLHSNLRSWRGPEARRLKAELKEHLDAKAPAAARG
jgi:hypothetical protein